MSRDLYPYSAGDRLEDRNTYFYSAYHGQAFLEAWQASRSAARVALPAPRTLQPIAATAAAQPDPDYDTGALLAALLEQKPEHHPLRDRLLQRFEVSKRIYRRYDADLKAIRDSGYDDLTLYLGFAALCVHSQDSPAALRFLNALLKAVDILISARARLSPAEAAHLAWLIEQERGWVERLAVSVGVEVVP